MYITVVIVRDPDIMDAGSGQANVSDTTVYIYPGHLHETDAVLKALEEENFGLDTEDKYTLTSFIGNMHIRVEHRHV